MSSAKWQWVKLFKTQQLNSLVLEGFCGWGGLVPGFLTHWGRVTHICISKLTIIGPDNGLAPERRQAIIWTSAGILLIGPLGTNFNEILIEIQTFSLKKICLKMSSAKCCSFRLGLNVLRDVSGMKSLLLCWGFVPPGHLCFVTFNRLRLRQNGCHFADNIFKWIFFNENE